MKPLIIQAIEAVKLCEVANGVEPVTNPDPVKVAVPASVTTVEGTVTASVPCNLTPLELSCDSVTDNVRYQCNSVRVIWSYLIISV